MGVTAKQIADQLGISQAAVSLALNGRPGVSTKTRTRVLQTAKALGYDFSRPKAMRSDIEKTVALITFNRNMIFGTPFFSKMTSGIASALREQNVRLSMVQISSADNLSQRVQELDAEGYSGYIVLATEMDSEDLAPLVILQAPMVLLDTSVPAGLDCIQINNHAGMKLAVSYLTRKYSVIPGYLHSQSTLSNFKERSDGYFMAVRDQGGDPSQMITHELPTIVDQAKHDMLSIIDSGKRLARCYVADFDDIAIGAMEAFMERGYRVPEDVSFVGFDNTIGASYVRPGLTTINVPSEYMGKMAASRLIQIMGEQEHHPIRLEIGVSLITRDSA